MFDSLKERVFRENLRLVEYGLVILTWGNVSAYDRENGAIAIKPSGVSYDAMTVEDIVVLDLDGNILDGHCKPSSDTPTHLALYRAFPAVGGIVHTHSSWATSFAQAGMDIPVFGTTHADTFYGAVPVTRSLTDDEIRGEYEKNTGLVIAETFAERDPMSCPAALVRGHGPFTWGATAEKAVEHALILEETAKMAIRTQMLSPDADPISRTLQEKHYFRKHGAGAYYGQD